MKKLTMGLLRGAHYVNLEVRAGGESLHLQADWIRSLLKYIRHDPNCRAGNHCEDPFCHHNGSCVCGLDDVLKAAFAEHADPLDSGAGTTKE
jgi:hypothetical protein